MAKSPWEILGVPVQKITREEIKASNILFFTKRARQIISTNLMPVQLEITQYYPTQKASRIFNDAIESSVVELARLFT